MEATKEQLVFEALADPTRRLIIQRLVKEEVTTATRLTGGLSLTRPISRQAVTKHLTTLVEAGLLVSQVEGKERRYQLHPQPLHEVSAWITKIESQWNAKLDALEQFLK